MHQFIALSVLVAVNLLLNGASAARMAADGNWGGALGLFGTTLIIFYAINGSLYLLMRLLRGKNRVTTFSSTKLHYVGLVILVIAFLGQAAQRGAQLQGG